MKNIITVFLLLAGIQAYCQSKQSVVQHVILIGIDGVSAEAFQYASTPIMDELVAKGAVSLITRGVMPTVSAPNWATILSGAGPEQHGVTSNNWKLTNKRISPTVKDSEGYFTSIFTLIRKQKPFANTCMFYDWDWLGTYINKRTTDTMVYVKGTQAVTDAASSYIIKNRPYFSFIYYGFPDETGHEKGFNTPAYYEAISEVDGEIRRLFDSVQYAGILQNTVFIITSDHGGLNFGHGGESMTELEVPWIISGPGIRKNIVLQNPNNHDNTAPTIAALLGLKIPVEWTGVPFDEAFQKNKIYNKSIFNSYVPKVKCSVSNGIYLTPQPAILSCKLANAEIHYTLDGSIPDIKSRKYQEPLLLATPITLTAVAIANNSVSEPIVVKVNIVKGISSISLATPSSPKYPGQGAVSLLDGDLGTADFTGNAWMGFEGTDFETTIDFGRKRDLTGIGITVMYQPENWIFLPSAVEFYTSTDGTEWQPAGTADTGLTLGAIGGSPVTLLSTFPITSARFVRVKAINTGVCPEGHPGAGKPAWLFVSEIVVN